MRTLLLALTIALLATPLAMAQEEQKPNEPRPDDAAWTEDCPPDMMCAANEASVDCSDSANGERDECKPSDAEEGYQYGPDGCIDCSGMAPDTCMDGAGEGEVCRDDLQYMDGRGPADCENCRGPTSEEDPRVIMAPNDGAPKPEAAAKQDVPGAGLGLVVAAFAVAIALVARRL